jgi:hypothetical protein
MVNSDGPQNGHENADTPDYIWNQKAQPDEIDVIIHGLIGLAAKYSGVVHAGKTLEYIKVIFEHQLLLAEEKSDPNKPLTVPKLEDMYLTLGKSLIDVNCKAFAKDLVDLEKERELIAKKKSEFRLKGIKLRAYQSYSTTLMTAVGPVCYSRMALRPSFSKDKRLLKEMGVNGYIFPLDETLGLPKLPYKMTIDAMLIVAKQACKSESYEDTEHVIKNLTSIVTSDDTIRAVINTIGSLIRANDMAIASQIWAEYNSSSLIFPEAKKDDVLYLQCDGAMIATRQERPLSSDASSNGDGDDQENKKSGVVWKENKLGVAFSSDNIRCWDDKHGKPQHQISKREYISLIGNSEDFSKLMFSLAIRNGYGTYNQTVIISDGATWIRNMKEMYFPDSIQILDFYHLSEHIYTFAKDVFNSNEEKYRPWAKTITKLFKKSKSKEAIKIIKDLPKRQLAKANFDFLQYVENNKNNIDYLWYKSQKYFIGSGAIESGNKIVLQRRLKQGGMRWNIDSAQAMLSLIAKLRSERWETDVVDLVYNYYAGAPAHILKQRVPSSSSNNTIKE